MRESGITYSLPAPAAFGSSRCAQRIIALALFALVSCSDRPPGHTIERTIERTQVVESAGIDLFAPSSAADRFGMSAPRPASAPELVWDTPPGWVELAPSAMRQANFRVAGDERAECYLTLLSGDAGGLVPNVQRWRAQMSLAPASQAELAALERAELFGREAALLDVAGTWTGMSGAERREDQRLVGLLLVDPNGSAFLKMVGPESVVATEIEAFRALARSLRLENEPSGDGSVREPQSGPGDSAGSTADLAWTEPSGWRRAPARATRAVSYFVGEQGDTECYVTVLPGGAGGALANVNRWRAQLGLSELSASALAGLPRVPLLGAEGLLVEAEGAGEAAGTLLLGAILETEERSIFVKLSGPRAVVEPERPAFLSFCRSLSFAR